MGWFNHSPKGSRWFQQNRNILSEWAVGSLFYRKVEVDIYIYIYRRELIFSDFSSSDRSVILAPLSLHLPGKFAICLASGERNSPWVDDFMHLKNVINLLKLSFLPPDSNDCTSVRHFSKASCKDTSASSCF